MSVRRAVRGVTTAVHTDALILHSAAAVDFIGCVRELLDGGHHDDAAALWDSVAEVVHFPIPERPVKEFASLPPMRLGGVTGRGSPRMRLHCRGLPDVPKMADGPRIVAGSHGGIGSASDSPPE